MAEDKNEEKQLVSDYLSCIQAKTACDNNLISVKQKLLEYYKKSNKKIIKGDQALLTVSVKNRTVFPKLKQPGRKELEDIVKKYDYWDKTLSFDVIKLAEAYDNNKLPEELKAKLAGIAKSEPQIRIFVNQ